MRYETVKTLKDADFKRLTGVKRGVYEKMLAIQADQLLLTLMYWHEYRTEFHIGGTYGVSEATVCRTIQKVEAVLLKSGEFRLPSRKALQSSDTWIEVVLVDTTEQPIERPKKSNAGTTAAKRSGILRKHNGS